MSNATRLAEQGICPGPFLQEDLFPAAGGFVDGRFCADMLGGSKCCLPCPQTDWLYPDNFRTISNSASWINVGGMACSLFLLASFAFLPKEKTHRHYLSICLAVAIIVMQLGFIVPLGARPEACYNAITPHDMKTSTTCALSGAFLLAGGFCAVMWIFLRALALHLQICWEIVIGKTFMWAALATGWGIPALIVTVAMIFSGVSFRFGDTCHINHKNSLAGFWIPLLVFAGITVFIQFGTFAYCIKVYLASLRDDSTTTSSSGLRSNATSLMGNISPGQAYRRVRRVIELQWRGITIVILIICDVIFFAVVFVFMDDLETSAVKNPSKAKDWLQCLAFGGSKNECLKLASNLVINQATVMAVLMLLSLNGIFSLLFLGRYSMFVGWYEIIMCKMRPNNEFISADVRAFKVPVSSYEMLSKERDRGTRKIPEPIKSDPISPLSPQAARGGRETPDYFGREARYKSPSHSFSGPKVPVAHAATSPPPRAFYPYAGIHMDPLSMNKI
ncbi:hypothetical protein MBM_01409 [Drepanopeziza brunnea f. sp. 'multigermtubi' MB_m1]|uniref:G-protein coupled receptors family 2 profile 2 domain-containing protein n=1 Tax=Marssonina brunnea f. sp. multigermtubi (strain MB_m1) TaxID=1072389 RepID=K1X6J5_MARBU|nr:uncharacterized protein MBM_01409 [Drepanopeziza brunnea f. sp. 'multigermtubi' MB_m1]EKD20727.1 hypothetical protein MBM_01409 [Drepanopeziza brunnea f. sp. 'multigermtubi' MB_m1]